MSGATSHHASPPAIDPPRRLAGRCFTTALLYAVVLLGTLLGGYQWSSHDDADSDEARMWAWCKATMVIDKQGKASCSPAYPGPGGK